LEPSPVPGVVNCVAYAKGHRVSEVPVEDISEVLEQPGGFVWLGLYEPGPELLQTVQREFGLHELAIEDALLAHQRPKLERYGDSLFMALRTAQMDREHHCAEFGETHIFVGARYIVSVRHGASLSYAPVRARCEANPRLLALGPGFVMYAIMDFIVDQYFPVVDELETELERVEEAIFGERMSRETTEEIYNLKRSLLELKRAVSPLVDICNRLVRFDLELVPDDVRPYIRDVYDHSVRINESVDTLRELLTSALEANLSLIAVAQNESMKKLAAWAAIIAVPTMIAGIYGMNFEHMPELHWAFGYPVVMGGMITACVGLYFHFKRSGWL
jgi:magnesium transporter